MEVNVQEMGTEPCGALERLHGQWLERVELRSYTGDSLTFTGASKILHCCPSLVKFGIRLCKQPRSPEAVQSLFLDTWQNPRMEWFWLKHCVSCLIEVPFKHRGVDVDTSHHGQVGTMMTTAESTGNGEVVQHGEETRLVRESDMELEFLKKISACGWRLESSPDKWVENSLDAREVRQLRDRVFQRLLGLSCMRHIGVEGDKYVRRPW